MPINEELLAIIQKTARETVKEMIAENDRLRDANSAASLAQHELNCPGRTAGKAWVAIAAVLAAAASSVLSGLVMWLMVGHKGGL